MLKRAIAVAGLIAISAITTQSALAQSPGGTLEKIVASKTFAIAYREESVPFSFIDSSGNPKGYAIDICLKIAEEIKTQFKLDKLDIKYVPITRQTRSAEIADGAANGECA